MQDEINLLKEQVDYLNDGNRKLHASYETRTNKLQNKLDTCENKNGAILSLQSSNQVFERKIKGIGQTFLQSYRNSNLNIKMVLS